MKKKKNSKTLILWSIGVGLLAIFTYLTVETATSGAALAILEKQENSLSQENKELEESIARASSLNGFESRSSELGFAQPATILYISGDSEVAKLP